MTKHFFYKREAQIKKLDGEGKPIPKTVKVAGANPGDPEVVQPIPGQFETESVTYTDHFNMDLVIRSHTLREGEVVVLLNDGHEVTEKVPFLKNPRKSPTSDNIGEEKQRVWVQSEFILKGEDVKRYYDTLKNLI